MHGRHAELYRRGGNIALGSDSANWSNDFDLWRQASLAVMSAREAHEDRTYLVAEDGIEMATAVEETSATAEQMSRTSRSVAEQVKELEGAAASTSATLTELAASVEEVAATAEKAAVVVESNAICCVTRCNCFRLLNVWVC